MKPFELSVKTGGNQQRTVSSTLFTIPDYHPALTRLVHVLRPAADRADSTSMPESPATPLPRLDGRGEAAGLTVREKEILGCLVRGLATTAIAKQLRIARVTVRNHVQGVLQKLNVHSKLEAVALANRLHLA